MSADVVTEQRSSAGRTFAGVLSSVQLLLVLAYGYGAVAYLTTDALYFPEQSPPGWSWPAVLVTALGLPVGVICLVLAWWASRSPEVRSAPRVRALLLATSIATGVMVLVMATPPGWELFDWYVS
ncbi:hypothetical protein [Catellatospora sp. NPDC049609]|uniref:hypothetical protein n=1 Tax=Catellatospora sp. NPDC049609 TaxID=3155505 RepID=UPI00343757F5